MADVNKDDIINKSRFIGYEWDIKGIYEWDISGINVRKINEGVWFNHEQMEYEWNVDEILMVPSGYWTDSLLWTVAHRNRL